MSDDCTCIFPGANPPDPTCKVHAHAPVPEPKSNVIPIANWIKNSHPDGTHTPSVGPVNVELVRILEEQIAMARQGKLAFGVFIGRSHEGNVCIAAPGPYDVVQMIGLCQVGANFFDRMFKL